MSELDELKSLVERMATSATKMQEENARLIAALARQPRVAAGGQPVVNHAAIRSEKLAKLSLALRKSGNVKDFKDTQECNVREWLKRF